MVFVRSRILSPGALYRFLEIVLIVFLAVQTARIIWLLATPLTPWGEVRNPPLETTANPDFDPFFRLSAQPQGAVVTSLALKLFGTRVDEAMGGGSAIIETPDGIQSSFLVGEEIVPGVKLKSVSYDGVVIDRGGAAEQLFLDQSIAAPVAKPATPTNAAVAPAQPAAAPASASPQPPVTMNATAPQMQGPMKQ
jgi:general secretion pathway protein C